MSQRRSGRNHDGAMFWVMMLLIVMWVLALALVIPSSWLHEVERLERQFYAHSLGPLTAEAVQRQAQQWFHQQFVITGEFEASRAWVRMLGQQLAWANTDWLHERVQVFWLTMTIATLRAALLTAAWPLLLGLFAGGLFDGLHRWRIRQLGFDYPSPKQRQFNQLGLAVVIGLLALLVLAPIPFHPAILPFLLMTATILLAGSLAHRPKQL